VAWLPDCLQPLAILAASITAHSFQIRQSISLVIACPSAGGGTAAPLRKSLSLVASSYELREFVERQEFRSDVLDGEVGSAEEGEQACDDALLSLCVKSVRGAVLPGHPHSSFR